MLAPRVLPPAVAVNQPMAARRKKLPRFAGELSQPIKTGGKTSLLLSEAERDAWWQRHELALIDARLSKLPLLMQHYAIDPDKPHCMLLLAMALAIEFVPGFQRDTAAARPSNRPKKHDANSMTELLMRVEMTKLDHPGISDRAICELLVIEDFPELKGARYRTQRAKKTKTLANLLAISRKSDSDSTAFIRKIVEIVQRAQTSRKVLPLFSGHS
jgi:hypothetical protein